MTQINVIYKGDVNNTKLTDISEFFTKRSIIPNINQSIRVTNADREQVMQLTDNNVSQYYFKIVDVVYDNFSNEVNVIIE